MRRGGSKLRHFAPEAKARLRRLVAGGMVLVAFAVLAVTGYAGARGLASLTYNYQDCTTPSQYQYCPTSTSTTTTTKPTTTSTSTTTTTPPTTTSTTTE